MIVKLEHQHHQLLLAYQHDTAIKLAFNNCDGSTSFEAGWLIVQEKKFDILRDFCGGLASVFPNTASVESDFSILGWEKNEYRKSLTDLSLEGIIHCKQYELLSSLMKWVVQGVVVIFNMGVIFENVLYLIFASNYKCEGDKAGNSYFKGATQFSRSSTTVVLDACPPSPVPLYTLSLR